MTDRIAIFRAAGYGCLKAVELGLSPLHALIGPNDSGKSTILRALRTVLQLASGFTVSNERGQVEPFDPSFGQDGQCQFELAVGQYVYRVGLSAKDTSKHTSAIVGMQAAHSVVQGVGVIVQEFERPLTGESLVAEKLPVVPPSRSLRSVLSGGARFLRLDPGALREPSTLIPETDRLRLQDPQGRGLPGVYDAIQNRGDGFQEINAKMRELFPTVKRVRLKVLSDSTKAFEFELTSGETVPAALASDGQFYYLAFAAIPYLEPTSLLLIEEPENGLHPARIRDVVRVLRKISQTTQVVIATHSPLVINELQPEEVTVVTRDATRGTLVTPLQSTPHFAERSKVYALGELWVSYCNGSDEAPLINGGPRS